MQKKIKIDRKKLRKITKTKNAFLSLATSIIYQQISTSAGDAIYKKFIKLFKSLPAGRQGKPTPDKLLKLSDQKIRSAGVSPQKLSYLRDLAQKFQNKTFSYSHEWWNDMSDEEVKTKLVQVKGIGPWTADMFLIFALNRPDILPIGDLGIKKGFQKVFKLKKLPTERIMYKLAKPHAGERTYLSLHLWDSIDTNPDI